MMSVKRVPSTIFASFARQYKLVNHGNSKGKNIALAISGGVDSMSLAFLCSELKRLKVASEDVTFHALIVDHGARKESAEEAKAVQRVLERIGLHSRVLKISWPFNTNPSHLPNFESMARRYRFQAMGEACRDLKAKYLFLAHHANDQAETVFMRIADGKKGRGVQGISVRGNIPECYGIHGVYQSGGEPKELTISATLPRSQTNQQQQHQPPEHYNMTKPPTTDEEVLEVSAVHPESNINEPPFESTRTINPVRLRAPLCENGGIEVCRPLLQFQKMDLIDICKSHTVEWFEDATNADPTLTTRNAVRNIYEKKSLPAALRLPSLCDMDGRIRSFFGKYAKVARKRLTCTPTLLETRAGTLTIRFSVRTTYPAEDLEAAQLWRLFLLRDITECVSPEEHVPLRNMRTALRNIFPELNTIKSTTPTVSRTFTLCGVKFEFLGRHSHNPSAHFDKATEPNVGREYHIWRISRQPYISDISKHPKIIFNSSLQRRGFQSSTILGSPAKWVLYDGRFWIKVENLGLDTLHVRPFRKEERKSFLASLDASTRETAEKFLKDFAPGSIRWTLPAIVSVDKNGVERVIALPSLGIRADSIKPLCQYDVRFKKVSRGLQSRPIQPAKSEMLFSTRGE